GRPHGGARSAGRRTPRPRLPGLWPRLGGRPRHRRLRPRRGRRARDASARRGARAGQGIRLARGRHPRAESGTPAALSRARLVMRDFLERLMERTTEPARVRPRAVGRFELGPWLDAGGTTTAAPDAAGAADRRIKLPQPP